MYLKDPDSELLAIQVIELMSRDLEARVRFLELGATRQLIIAISDYRRPQFQSAAVEALFWLCDDCGNRLECSRFEGFQRLMGLTADLENPVIAQGAAQVPPNPNPNPNAPLPPALPRCTSVCGTSS